MNYGDLVASVFGKLLLAGGGGAVFSIAILRAFGSKWLDAYFARKAAALKSEQERGLADLKAAQDRGLRQLQSYLDRDSHRAKMLFDREFDVLAEAWLRLSRCYDFAVGSWFDEYTQFENLTEDEFEVLLATTDLNEHERDEMRALEPAERTEKERRRRNWARLHVYIEARRELSTYLKANGIFMRSDILALFNQLQEPIAAVFAEFETRLRLPGLENFKALQELDREDFTKAKNGLQALIHERLWSSARAEFG